MDSAYKLAIEIVANAKNFEVTMNSAGGVADEVTDKVQAATDQNSEFAGSFGKIGSGIGKFMGVAAAAAGVIDLVKSSMEAVEGPGDKLEAITVGVKESMFELQRSIANIDFSNFLNNLLTGYERGKKFAEMMDDLKDKTAYSDYKVAGLKAQSAELAETIKNKRLDISVRTQYAEDRKKIEEQIMLRTQDIAQKAFMIEKQHWQDRNKMSTDEAIKLYETIDNLSGDVAKKLQDAFNTATKIMGRKEGTKRLLSGLESEGMLKGVPPETIASYAKYLDLLRTGESDVLVKLFNTYKNIDQVRFESQRSYNLAVRETSMLLNGEEAAQNKVINRLKEMSSLEGFKQPGVGSTTIEISNQLAGGPAAVKPDEVKLLDQAYQAMIDKSTFLLKMDNPIEIMKKSLEGLTSSLMQGASSFKGYARVVVGSIKEVIGAMLAESVATSISAALKSAKLAGPFGVFLIPALAAMGAGLARTAFNSLIPSFAGGAVVSGPTYAQVGEYPGARNNPEVISPLSKLKDMIGGGQMMPQRVRLMVDVGGNMNAYFEYQNRKLNNYR